MQWLADPQQALELFFVIPYSPGAGYCPLFCPDDPKPAMAELKKDSVANGGGQMGRSTTHEDGHDTEARAQEEEEE
jgi:hypothetical protein